MARLFSTDLPDSERGILLGIARESIHRGLHRGSTLEVELQGLPDTLSAPMAVFVTLTMNGSLRGCIGALQSSGALAQSVADSAYGAAFEDPRFPQLRVDEFDGLAIEISVLSQMQPLPVNSRAELRKSLSPGTDGLLLEDGRHRSTFLPQVWEHLPDPEEFLRQLFTKAGLPPDHWSSTLRICRYHALSFSE